MSEIDEKRLWIIEARDGAWGANGICKGELVRCGECNRHEEPRDTGLKAFVWCNLYNTHKLKNGYCNCGERKDGERKDDDKTGSNTAS